MRNRKLPKVITNLPTASCYRACRKAISLIDRKGVIKTDLYVYRAIKVPHKQNTVMVSRCYRDYFKEPEYPGKWQEIGLMPIDPKGDFG